MDKCYVEQNIVGTPTQFNEVCSLKIDFSSLKSLLAIVGDNLVCEG